MKYLRKKEKKKHTGLIVLICVLCAAVIAAALWFALSRNDDAPSADNAAETSSAGSTVSTETVIEPVADFNIETPYGTIVFSGEWGNHLDYNVVDGESAAVQFAAVVRGEKVPLFDLLFNCVNGERFGYLTDESGKQVSVSVEIYDITPADSWSEEEKYMVYGMQDELNDVIAQFTLTEEADTAAASDDITIETPYGELRYPGIWSGCLRTEVKNGDGCVVSFYGNVEEKEEVHLFDIVIGGSGESYIGTITCEDGSTAEVYMTSYEFAPDGSWSENEINAIYGMQEAANHIFEKLEDSGKFTF